MRWRRLGIVAAPSLLAACALVSGAADLTVGTQPAPTEPEASTPDAPAVADAIASDGAVDADARAGATCDEPGLVARWTFDEGAGVTVKDCTRLRHDGVLDGGGWIIGVHDGGVALDGGWAGFGDPADLQLTAAVSACAWVKPLALMPNDTERDYVVAKLSNPSGGGWRVALSRGSSPATIGVALNVPDGDGGYNEARGGAMPVGAWSHVCGVFGQKGSFVYVNGVRAGSDASPSKKITPTSDELRVGARSDGTQPLHGSVDEVRIYDRELTDGEIAALAQP